MKWESFQFWAPWAKYSKSFKLQRCPHLFQFGSKGQSDREDKHVSAVISRANLMVSLLWDQYGIQVIWEKVCYRWRTYNRCVQNLKKKFMSQKKQNIIQKKHYEKQSVKEESVKVLQGQRWKLRQEHLNANAINSKFSSISFVCKNTKQVVLKNQQTLSWRGLLGFEPIRRQLRRLAVIL